MKWLFLIIGIGGSLAAQTPTALEQHFNGRRVKVLLDMPGDDSGVDVRARETPSVSADLIAAHVLKYGAALRRGQIASVTLVKIKGDHIEFQLDGGGFTNRQLLGLPGIDSARWGTSEEERKIRSSIIGTRDKDRRRRLESQYDSARLRRVRPLRQQLEREQREKSGSRFNIRFTSDRETALATPEELIAIMRPYLELQ
jgi:hypothetical protein